MCLRNEMYLSLMTPQSTHPVEALPAGGTPIAFGIPVFFPNVPRQIGSPSVAFRALSTCMRSGRRGTQPIPIGV